MILAELSYPPFPMLHVLGLRLSIHGVFIALAIFAGAALSMRRYRTRGDTSSFESVLSWAVVGALVGARYLTVPAAILAGDGLTALNPVGGNFSILGGFAGGIAAGLWRIRALQLPMLPTLDVAAPGLALGTVIGRLGCLAIVEHLGRPSSLPWAYAVKPGYELAPQHAGLQCSVAQTGATVCGTYHPVALYDLVGALVLLGILLGLSRRAPLRSGQLFAVWMAWYGLQRFLLDFLRVGDATIGPITWNQATGLTAGLGGVVLLWWLRGSAFPPDPDGPGLTRAVSESSPNG